MKLIKSFKFAIQGIIFGFQNERNMRVHFLATIIAIAIGFYFKISQTEWLVIVLAIAMVIATELLNTAIEKTINGMVKSNPERYDEMGLPKDLAAGAVLATACGAAIVGLIIFLPHLLKI